MNIQFAGYNYDGENPKLRLKENIRISKMIKEDRCAWCRSFISKGQYHFSINNVGVTDRGNFISSEGRPIHIHLDCIMPMAKRMERHKLDNTKRVCIASLKDENK